MSAVAADLNNDGWIDLYVANDSMENYYYENKGDGTFAEKALGLGLALGQNGQGVSSMGPAVADLNGDGILDILIPDMDYGSLLSKQGGVLRGPRRAVGPRRDLRPVHGLGRRAVRLRQRRLPGRVHRQRQRPPRVPRGRGAGAQQRARASSWTWRAQSGDFFQTKWVGRGATWADFDDDGNVDLLVVDTSGPPHLLRNGGGTGNHWLKVDATLKGGTRTAIGARVTVSAGGRTQFQDVIGVNGYLSQGDTRAHFGLGAADEGRPRAGPLARRHDRRVEGREGGPGASRRAGEEVSMRRAVRLRVAARRGGWRRCGGCPRSCGAQAVGNRSTSGARACAQCHEGKAAGNQYSHWLLTRTRRRGPRWRRRRRR